jgi:preprotein translocase subunit Sec63
VMNTCYCVLLVCLSLAVGVLAERDFYKILDIGANAEASEIKRAYRSQSLKYHPDKNPGKYAFVSD